VSASRIGLEELRVEGVELGPGPQWGAAGAGRLGMVAERRERVPGEVELTAGGARAQAIDADAATARGAVHEVGVHPETSRLRDRDQVSEPPLVVPRP
jgi:hypothetical protein